MADNVAATPVRLPPTTTSTKRLSKSKNSTPIAKRLRFTIHDNETRDEEQQPGLQQLLNYIKQVDTNVTKVQKQQEQLTITLERQYKLLNSLCVNQRRLAKSLARRKVRKTVSN